MMTFAQSWWALALRGALAVVFGVIAFVSPGLTALALVLAFGVYALLDGILAVAADLLTAGSGGRWWPLVLIGLVGIAAGVLTFIVPAAAAAALLAVIAAWAIVTGGLQLYAAVQLRRVIDGEWLLGAGGALAIVVGVLLVAFPQAGVLTIVYLIGACAVIAGVMLIVLGFRLRGVQRRPDRGVAAAEAAVVAPSRLPAALERIEKERSPWTIPPILPASPTGPPSPSRA